jgi:hypothetical protein
MFKQNYRLARDNGILPKEKNYNFTSRSRNHYFYRRNCLIFFAMVGLSRRSVQTAKDAGHQLE